MNETEAKTEAANHFTTLGTEVLGPSAIVVIRCGRICLGNKKVNFSQVFAGQAVGIKEEHDDIWLVSSMDYDLGYFDLETRVLEPLENPFGPEVLPRCTPTM